MSLTNPQPSLENPPTPETDDDGISIENPWLRTARQSYESSSEWVDANLRYQWEKSLSLFNSKHPSGSKYLSSSYDKRSRFFRPKTRTAVRNLQSAMSIAFFSNEDVMSVEPRNPNDTAQAAAALETDKDDNPILNEDGEESTVTQVRSINDAPKIELVSPENLRIDPAAHWEDPIGTTPYIIHLIPMYIQDVVQKMDEGEWNKLSVGELLSTGEAEDDNTTRLVRDEPRMDPLDTDAGYGEITDHKIVWIHKNVLKKDGVDWCFFTAGTQFMLTDPRPLHEMYPWLRDGERPYVMGCVNIEAHKLYPSGTVELTQELQAAANDIWNQRFDNVRLAMNKRYHIRRDRNIDLDALFRSVPGGAVEMDDPDSDVRVIDTRDVTASAYAEQDRINMDFDELQGNFSTSTVQGARSQ